MVYWLVFVRRDRLNDMLYKYGNISSWERCLQISQYNCVCFSNSDMAIELDLRPERTTYMLKTMYKHTLWCFDNRCCYCNCQGTRDPLCFHPVIILKYTHTYMCMSEHTQRNTWLASLSPNRHGDTQTDLTDWSNNPCTCSNTPFVSVTETEEESWSLS